MIDDELALAGEQLGESLCSLRRVEDIWLLHLHPGQSTTLGASRARVNSFSLASRSLRAASHSLSETILCSCMMDSTVGGRAQRLSGDRSHPADTGAARLAQDGDAADTRNVEERLHELGAGLNRLGDALIHVVDREIGHPAFR